MSNSKPIACSLNVSEMSVRLAEMAEVGHRSLKSSDRAGSRALLRFDADRETRARLTQIVAAERECCAFLTFDLRSEGDQLTLSVQAPLGGELVLDEIVSAFAADRTEA
jgi:hypothetical protein